MRALVVTNMYPSERRPALGVFVRDQVEALRGLDGVELELFAFDPGGRAYIRAARELRRRYGRDGFDVVHAHFGLTAWPALAARGARHVVTLHGNDLWHPVSRRVTRAVLPLLSLVAATSATFAALLRGAGSRRRVAVLPCGVDLDRFRPIARAEARARLGLDPAGPYLLFPHDPGRVIKRFENARHAAGDVPLLTLGAVEPSEVPYWINAANAVLVPSAGESFGLATLEALACDVPVLATPVGVAPLALSGVAGTLCAAYERDVWRAALEPHLGADDPRVAGRDRAALFSSRRMAERVAIAWKDLLLA